MVPLATGMSARLPQRRIVWTLKYQNSRTEKGEDESIRGIQKYGGADAPDGCVAEGAGRSGGITDARPAILQFQVHLLRILETDNLDEGIAERIMGASSSARAISFHSPNL